MLNPQLLRLILYILLLQRTILFLLSIILLTSCFEIVEDVTVNEDGSGTFKITNNLSQSAAKLKTIMLLDTAFGMPIPTQKSIEDSIAKAITQLEKIPGITNVQKKVDFELFVFSIAYDFDNPSTLNKSFLEIARVFDKKATLPYTPFEISEKKFIRNHELILTETQKNKLITQHPQILTSAKYISIYRFNTNVVSCTNTSCTIGKSQKLVINKVSFGDLLLKPEKIRNHIIRN